MAPSTRGTKCGSCRRLPRGLGTPLVESLTGFVGRLGVWRLVHAEIEGVRRDLSAQISAVNTRIDNVLLADRKRSSPSVTTSRLTVRGRPDRAGWVTRRAGAKRRRRLVSRHT